MQQEKSLSLNDAGVEVEDDDISLIDKLPLHGGGMEAMGPIDPHLEMHPSLARYSQLALSFPNTNPSGKGYGERERATSPLDSTPVGAPSRSARCNLPTPTPRRSTPRPGPKSRQSGRADRTGPPVSLYEQAFLRIVDSAKSPTTAEQVVERGEMTTAAHAKSCIPAAVARVGGRKKLDSSEDRGEKVEVEEIVGDEEDPFAGFDSGEEGEEEGDEDFAAEKLASSSPSPSSAASGMVTEEDEGMGGSGSKSWPAHLPSRSRANPKEKAKKSKREGDDPTSDPAFRRSPDSAIHRPPPTLKYEWSAERNDELLVERSERNTEPAHDSTHSRHQSERKGVFNQPQAEERMSDEVDPGVTRNGRDWTLVVDLVEGKKVWRWEVMRVDVGR
ncbi:MAG: hypothetical protein Q9170_006974 [Blastenia crenularia]